MLYIRKRKTPQYIKDKRDEIIKTPDSGYNGINLPEDADKLRRLFDLMPKPELRALLCKEQHGLCAYCMRKIVPEKQKPGDEEARIEHYVPLSIDKDLALDYGNFLGVCYGGNKDEREEKERLITCCDAHRGNERLTINPYDERQMKAIAYRRDGFVFVKRSVGLDSDLADAMQNDINDVLHLNGELDQEKRVIHDTTSRLLANRKRVYDSVSSQIERWDKQGVLTTDYIKEKLNKLSERLKDDNTAEPFIGVRIYHLEKKMAQLKKMER